MISYRDQEHAARPAKAVCYRAGQQVGNDLDNAIATTGSSVKTILKVIAAVCGLLCFTASAANQPNIVFIMADDLGNADVGYHGSDIKTPDIVSRTKQ